MEHDTAHKQGPGHSGSAAMAAGASTGLAAERKNDIVVRKRSTVELLDVGVVALGDNSHMNYSIWAPTINRSNPTSGRFVRPGCASHTAVRGPKSPRRLRRSTNAGGKRYPTWWGRSME